MKAERKEQVILMFEMTEEEAGLMIDFILASAYRTGLAKNLTSPMAAAVADDLCRELQKGLNLITPTDWSVTARCPVKYYAFDGDEFECVEDRDHMGPHRNGDLRWDTLNE